MKRITSIWVDDPNDEGAEIEIKLPTKYEVCWSCQGSGVSVAHVECDGGGFTSSEWAEQDEDFREGYMSGRYDRPCPTCNGKRVEEVTDYDALSEKHKKLYDEWCESEAQMDAEMAAERRAGC